MGCGESKEGGGYNGLTEGQISSIQDVKMAFASLSFIGSSTIILCYIRCRELRKFAFKLVFFVSVADWLSAIGEFISPPEDQCGPCLFQAFMVSIFNLSSVLWTGCIGHCLYRAVRHHDLDVEKYEIRYHIFAWGIPVLLALIPVNGMYGYDNGSCWILERFSYMRFIQFFIPLICTITYNGVIYYRVIKSLQAVLRTGDSGQRERDMETFWRMGLYPVVLLVCWFFGIINRLQNSANPNNPSFALYMLHRSLGSMQGLLNCLVYGMNRSVRQKLPEVFCCRAPQAEEAGGLDGIQMSQARAEGKQQEGASSARREGSDREEEEEEDAATASRPPARAPASDEV